MKKFDAAAFYNSFNVTIKVLAESERITKDALRSLSRECLMLLHYESNKQGDISPVNQILKVLTPRNKSAWIHFMQEFSGFRFDEKEQAFIKKDKSKVEKGSDATVYDVKGIAACERLDDPHFNLWSWAEANLRDIKKTSPIVLLGKNIDKALSEKDKETGKLLYSKADVLRTVLEHGITTDDLIEILQKMDVVEVN